MPRTSPSGRRTLLEPLDVGDIGPLDFLGRDGEHTAWRVLHQLFDAPRGHSDRIEPHRPAVRLDDHSF